MSRFAYVNGRYLRHRQAAVHIEDRGYQFADGIYEVIAIHRGRMVDEAPHLERLERSLSELRIPMPVNLSALQIILRRVIEMNRVLNGLVYVQITRGVAPRNHAFPKSAKPSLVATARRGPAFDLEMASRGVRVRTAPDIRWQRCDIKSIALLPNVLYKEDAVNQDCYETWMFDDAGRITEGTSSNAWIVTESGALVTRALSHAILPGITRRSVLAMVAQENLTLEERMFTVEEARAAKEAFLTSTTSFVKPVVQIDDQKIGNGEAGSLTRQLLEWYGDHMDGLDHQ